MSSAVQLGSVQLIPVKEAAEFVPYSRDYVARLAREGKVAAVQIDRQWFVDVISLQNFFAHATIEESVRKRHLSGKRKRDLEVKEVYQQQLQTIYTKHNSAHKTAVVQTGFVVACGLAAGLFFTTAQDWNVANHFESLAQIFLHTPTVQTAAVSAVNVETITALQAVDTRVDINDEVLDVRNGIVVLPGVQASTTVVEDFFSDPVTVEMTSTTTGEIRNTINNETIPFVKVPETTVVLPRVSGNEGAP